MDFFSPLSLVASFPPELGVFLLSMLPITGLRASIPIGIEVYGLPVIETWVIAVVGNILPTIFILLLFPKMHEWLIRQRFLGDVVKKKMQAASEKFSGRYAKYGAIALILFVGLPLPFTGAWTGSLAAFIFDIPFKKSLPLISIGVCIAATIVTLITVFAGGTLRWFLG